LTVRSAFRAWLTWLGDPQAPKETPTAPISVAAFAELVEACARHGVLPMATRHLKRLAEAGEGSRLIGAPDESSARAVLDRAIADASDRLASIVGFAELLRAVQGDVLQAFRAKGIDSMVLKGSTFADRLYPDPALRPFTDIDVIVPKAQLPGAREALKQAGLRLGGTNTEKHAGEYAEEKWVHPLLGQSPIELHWDLVSSPKVQRAISVTYEVLAPLTDTEGKQSSHALLLVSAVHGTAGHGFERFQHVIDVAQAARGAAGPIDAAKFLRDIPAGGLRLAVQAALLTAARTLGDKRSSVLARELGSGIAASALAGLLGTTTILEAVGPYHARYSWRRQLYREALVQFALKR
jgi:hypothetical protein